MHLSTQNSRFPSARQTLAAADAGVYTHGVLSEAVFATQCYGVRNAAFAAAKRWIASVCAGGTVSAETAIVSRMKLPMTACEELLAITSFDDYPVTCKMHARHLCKGAGGRAVPDTRELPEMLKIGPDSWRVTAQVQVHRRSDDDPLHQATAVACACRFWFQQQMP